MITSILAVMIIQFVFGCFNLYFSITQPKTSCMDDSYNGYVLRPWLLYIGKVEMFIFVGLALPLLLYKFKCVPSLQCLTCCWCLPLIVAGIKTIVWMVVVLQLYFNVIANHCDGSVYAYGTVLTILSIMDILRICCGCFRGEGGRA